MSYAHAVVYIDSVAKFPAWARPTLRFYNIAITKTSRLNVLTVTFFNG
jgi:hypothetical protein